jgi:hypothetical protein
MLNSKKQLIETIKLEDGWFFGFRLPFLPDFLHDHTLLGKEPEDRIREHCRSWTQFVGGLWRDDSDITYALRFDWKPVLNSGETTQINHASQAIAHKSGLIEIMLLIRWHPNAPNPVAIESNAQILAQGIEQTLQAFGFEPQVLTARELKKLINIELNHAYEVRQQEYSIKIRQQKDQSDPFHIPQEFVISPSQKESIAVFGIHPWWGPGGSYLLPFNTLTAQTQPVTLYILLHPTHLSEEEADLLAEIAREAESMAQRQTKPDTGVSGTQLQASQNRTDPQLRWAANLYSTQLRRLTHPFLNTIFCFSQSNMAAQQVAHAFANLIREEQSFEVPIGESTPIQSGAQVVACDLVLTKHMCEVLDLNWWDDVKSKSIAPHEQLKRLRYLMDARGAATVFRLPVSVRGGVPGIPVKQRPPDFHPGSREETVPPSAIDLGKFHAGGRAFVEIQELCKHALITGFTGSGKTNTLLYLLHQLWHFPTQSGVAQQGPNGGGIPFLVIESAKHEYRGLLGVEGFQGHDNLRIYTLGNENCAPFRLNPFQLLPGVRLESHINRLIACFLAALPQFDALPSILAEAIELIYQKKGWTLTSVGATQEDGEIRQFPTLNDLYNEIDDVVKQRNYVGELESNLKAATKSRIKTLCMGSLGSMFNIERNTEIEELFQRPVILELNDLNLDNKALVMMFVLTLLREYREQHPADHLQHVTVVEEAHNVLAKTESKGGVEGSGADIKAKSVEMFCTMLAEVRALGEGLIITDQSPNKLASDAMRNTNVQIAHQLRDGNDRNAIANAMIMDDEQRDFLGKLEKGAAAVFYTGLQKATFIQVPAYDKYGFRKSGSKNVQSNRGEVSDREIERYMDSLTKKYRRSPLPFSSCEHCQSQCRYRRDIIPFTEDDELQLEFQKIYDLLGDRQARKGINTMAELVQVCRTAASHIEQPNSVDASWCFLTHMWARQAPRKAYLKKGIRDKFVKTFFA